MYKLREIQSSRSLVLYTISLYLAVTEVVEIEFFETNLDFLLFIDILG